MLGHVHQGMWTLEFTSDGAGVLHHPDHGHSLPSNRLRFSYWKRTVIDTMGREDSSLVVKKGNQVLTRRDAVAMVKTRCVKTTSTACVEGFFLCYHFNQALGPSNVWWATTQLVDYVFSSPTQNNHVGRRREGWEKVLMQAGFEFSHIKAPLRSWYTKVQQGVIDDVPDEEPLLQYFAMTTEAVVVLTTHWSIHETRLEISHSQERACAILQTVIDRASMAGPVEIELSPSGHKIWMGNAGFRANCLETTTNRDIVGIYNRLIEDFKGQAVIPVSEFLQWLLVKIQRPSKHRSVKIGASSSVFDSIVSAMALQIELSTGEDWWQPESALHLAPTPAKRKHRVMNAAYREAVAQTSIVVDDPLSRRGLMGAQRVRSSSDTNAEKGVKSSASRTGIDHGLCCLAACRILFKYHPALRFTVDGITAFGDHNEIFMCWLPRTTTAAVAPIQAFLCFYFLSSMFMLVEHEGAVYGALVEH